MLKFGGVVFWRLGTRSAARKYSSPSATVFKTEKVNLRNADEDKSEPEPTLNIVSENTKSGLVAAVFANLNDTNGNVSQTKPSHKSIKTSSSQKIDALIKQASDVNSVLTIAEAPVISRLHALKIVSVLSEWSSTNKVKLNDFERDPRFLRLCRILARTSNSQAMSLMTRADDLGTVLGITGDDEAARLIGNLSLSQMVKVMQALAQQSRRSTPLLRALANNITDVTEPIDLKKSADLLFCMTTLNFPDAVLADRICSDIIKQLPLNTDKPSVVTSIVTSLGLLRYRHEEALSSLSEWVVRHLGVCRPQDVASAVVTLANLNYFPADCEELFQSALAIKESELVKSSCWLDLVFSLLILKKATYQHLVSTLKPEFTEKMLATGEIPITVRRKLMLIDAYVALMGDKGQTGVETGREEGEGGGVRLAVDVSVGVPIVYTKEKQLYVQLIMDTFKNFISSGNFLKRDCNSGMGFLYDGEFAVDSKCHPVPLSQAATAKDVFHIAVLGLDYHDMCRKVTQPLGVCQLYTRLLELKGFKVLQIPYTEFNPRDKLITRVQYIERRLKEIVGHKPAS